MGSSKSTTKYKKNHGITFEEAKTVFNDEKALLIYDPDHSDNGDRFILLGMSRKIKLSVVCHCYLEREDTIRIISVRKATGQEQIQYKESLQ